MLLKDIKKGNKVKIAKTFKPRSKAEEIFVEIEIYGVIGEDVQRIRNNEVLIHGYSGTSSIWVPYLDLILIEEEYSLKDYLHDYGGSMVSKLDANNIMWVIGDNEICLETRNDALPILIKIIYKGNRYSVKILEQINYSFTPRSVEIEESRKEVMEFALNRLDGVLQMLASIDMNSIKKEFLCKKP